MATHTFSSVYWSPQFPPESLPERQFSWLQAVLINLPYLNKMQNGKLQSRKASKLHQSNILGDLSKMLFAAHPHWWAVVSEELLFTNPKRTNLYACKDIWTSLEGRFLPSVYQLLFAWVSTAFRTLISWPGALTLFISALLKLFVFQRSW